MSEGVGQASPPSAPTKDDVAAGMKKAFEDVTERVPSGGSLPKVSGFSKDGGASEEFKEGLVELQSWDQPFYSASVLVGVSTLYYMTTGEGAYSVVSLVCYMLLVRLGTVAAARKALAGLEGNEKAEPVAKLIERMSLLVEDILVLPTPSQVSSLLKGFSGLVESRVNKICKVLIEATEPTKEGSSAMKKVLLHIFGVMVLLRIMSLWSLLYVYIVFQMTWPPIYSRNKEKIDNMSAQALTKAEPHIDACKQKMDDLLKALGEKAGLVLKALAEKAGAVGGTLAEKYKEKFSKEANGAPAAAAKPESKTE